MNDGLLLSEGWVGPSTLRASGLRRVVFGRISSETSRSLKYCLSIHCADVAQLVEQLISLVSLMGKTTESQVKDLY